MEKAKETFLKAWAFIKEKWNALNKTTRIVAMSVAAAMFVSIIALVALGRNTDMVVLYPGVSSSEIAAITQALNENVGVRFAVDNNNAILIPSSEVERARMELAILGYPRSTFNYDIWNNNIGMFSTEMQTREFQKQQLADNLRATLRSNPKILEANVLLVIPEQQKFVMQSNAPPATAGVYLTLRDGQTLTDREIAGITTLIMKSVPGISSPDDVSLNNQNGVRLVPDDAPDIQTLLAHEQQRDKQRLAFKTTMEKNMQTAIESLLDGAVTGFRVSVAADIVFHEWYEQRTDYTGSNIDENGFMQGILSESDRRTAWNMWGIEGGVPGTFPNADISPGYPTFPDDWDGEAFYENREKTLYLVNEYIRREQSDGYTLKGISAAVILDSAVMTQAQLDAWERLISDGIGAEVASVTVMAIPFPPVGGPSQYEPAPGYGPDRSLLIFIIIALGILLIVLFFLAMMTSGSKKKRVIRGRGYAAESPYGAGPVFDDGFSFPGVAAAADEEEEIKLQSLTSDGAETRDTLLKNEIREFAKSNPDIVAQLIRTWIRE
jgi:flagellar M-ring protein FliF